MAKETVNTNALATPVGILPETAFGTALTGALVDGGYSSGVSIIQHQTLGSSEYDADHIIGQRIQFHTNSQVYVVTNYNPATRDITFTPTLQDNLLNGEVIYILFLPIQNEVSTVTWENDTGRVNEGTINGGPYKNSSHEAGKMAKISLECKLGMDYFLYNTTLNKFSSLLAHLFTTDGKLDSVDGELTPRQGSTSNQISSLGLCYQVKPGKLRYAPGGIVMKASIQYDNDIHAIVKANFDLLAKEMQINGSLPTRTKVADITYQGAKVKSRGGTYIFFRYMSYVSITAASGQKAITAHCPKGFASGDKVTLIDKVTANTEDKIIDTIVGDVITVTVNLTNSYPADQCVILQKQGAAGSWNNPRVQRLSLELNNGGELEGDIASGSETPTMAFCTGSDYSGKLDLSRDDHDIIEFIISDSQFSFFALEVHHVATSVAGTTDFIISLECKKKENPQEEVTADYDKQMDTIGFQVSDIYELFIRNV